jgi:type II secretion system protein I
MTLLEVVVAMAVLAIGIVGVLHAFSSSIKTSKAAEFYSVATMLAQQVASELERRPGLSSGQLSGTFGETARGYTWTADVGQANPKGLLPVRVTVFWYEGTRSRHLQIATCLRPGSNLEAER